MEWRTRVGVLRDEIELRYCLIVCNRVTVQSTVTGYRTVQSYGTTAPLQGVLFWNGFMLHVRHIAYVAYF